MEVWHDVDFPVKLIQVDEICDFSTCWRNPLDQILELWSSFYSI